MSVDLSRQWLQTLPSITKFWFYSCVVTSIICTIPAFIQLPQSISFLFNGNLFALDWDLILSGQIWRLFTPFLVIGAFVPGLVLFTIVCLVIMGSYVRELEEHYYGDGPRGAARLTSVLLFGACVLMALANKVVHTPFLGMPLIFFAVSHLTLMNPWDRLGDSEIFLRWHLPYLLLVPLALAATPMVGQAFIGILIAYVHHVLTVRVKERFNIPLWTFEPSLLVRAYQALGVGMPKVGLTARAGHSIAEGQ